MEVRRWGQRKIQEIASKSRSLSNFLAEALEGERDLLGDDGGSRGACPSRFARNPDFRALERRLASSGSLDEAFSELMPWFEAGFSLRPADDGQALPGDERRAVSNDERRAVRWQVDQMFALGQAFLLGAEAVNSPIVTLPSLEANKVLRADGRRAMRAFGLEGVPRLRETLALLYKPSADRAVILATSLPAPWAMEPAEIVLRAFQACAGSVKPPRTGATERNADV